MPLGIVAEVVTHGGYLPQLVELNKKKRPFFSRRNGLGFSLIWFLFFLFIMAPFWGIVNVEELAGVSAVIGIFGGLILMISSFLFFEKEKPVYPIQQNVFQPPQFMTPPADRTALPGQQSIPVSTYTAPGPGNWRDTNDLQPTSVTEGTTKLLDKDEI